MLEVFATIRAIVALSLNIRFQLLAFDSWLPLQSSRYSELDCAIPSPSEILELVDKVVASPSRETLCKCRESCGSRTLDTTRNGLVALFTLRTGDPMTRSWMTRFRRLFYPWRLQTGRSSFQQQTAPPRTPRRTARRTLAALRLYRLNNDDSGRGTLRQVLAVPRREHHRLRATVRNITLTSGGLTIPKGTDVTIVNDLSFGSVTISGNDNFTVFTVNGSTTATLSGLTITDGFTQPSGGGGIVNAGHADGQRQHPHRTTPQNDYGGGIENLGTLTVSASTLSGNSANLGGGGIASGGDGTLTVSASTLSGNSAARRHLQRQHGHAEQRHRCR